jgi:hypothetical protein
MPLVNFKPVDLRLGYYYDLKMFNNEPKLKQRLISHTSFDNIESIDNIQKNINSILEEIKLIIKPEINNWQDFEYSHYVPDLVKKNKTSKANKLWGLRHALCYQLLIYTYYKSITTDFNVSEIQKFKLGIFGSVTPTSDIDIGFQYSKINHRKVGIIAHVVNIFEDAFIELTEKYSLGYDIEPYADMMYLDDESGGLFYCESNDFEFNDFLQMMPTIGASIIRNACQNQIDLSSMPDIRRYKNQQVMEPEELKNIQNYISTLSFDAVKDYFLDLIKTNDNQIKKWIEDTFSKNQSENSENSENNNWVAKSKELVKGYLTITYYDSRKKYYELVKNAEEILSNMNLSREAPILKEDRLNLMIAISTALVYRAESYVSPSTVMHVVRVMQGNETENTNCLNLPIRKSKAKCALGKFGYLMSCFEQIGYLYRFNKTYCEKTDQTELDKIKCDKKKIKYITRLNDGLKELKKLIKPTGGKKIRRYSKKNRFYKKKQTRRLKNSKKYSIKRLYRNV